MDIVDRLAEWLHQSSYRERYGWDSKTEQPIMKGRYLVPPDIQLTGITEEWIANARIKPKEAMYDLIEQCNLEFLDLDQEEFLEIIGKCEESFRRVTQGD